MTGVLSLLWFDIRNIRIKRESDRNEFEERYITKEYHCIICENAQLRTQKVLSEALNAAVLEIKSEIKKNGNGSGKGH